uniref:Uncharacterized protein n=1 Tax=Oryza brachyantha TaxID=4533 RepID=J3KW42_ORYBR
MNMTIKHLCILGNALTNLASIIHYYKWLDAEAAYKQYRNNNCFYSLPSSIERGYEHTCVGHSVVREVYKQRPTTSHLLHRYPSNNGFCCWRGSLHLGRAHQRLALVLLAGRAARAEEGVGALELLDGVRLDDGAALADGVALDDVVAGVEPREGEVAAAAALELATVGLPVALVLPHSCTHTHTR